MTLTSRIDARPGNPLSFFEESMPKLAQAPMQLGAMDLTGQLGLV
ncbi:MAG: hypothetical protein U0790_03980 [Isosphaeraceae bacterium]